MDAVEKAAAAIKAVGDARIEDKAARQQTFGSRIGTDRPLSFAEMVGLLKSGAGSSVDMR